MKNHQGFMLVELLIVVAAIAAIAATAIPNLRQSRIRANEAAAVTALKAAAAAPENDAGGERAARLGYVFMTPAGADAEGAFPGRLALPLASGATGNSAYCVDGRGDIWRRALAPGKDADALAAEFGDAADTPAGSGGEEAAAAGWVRLQAHAPS